MSSGYLYTLKIPAKITRTASIIWVHGLGQRAESWKALAEKHLVQSMPSVEWVFPQSINRPVSYNNGQIRPSWFDIETLPPQPDEYDEPSIKTSIAAVESLIQDQIDSGIDPGKIILIGFSQGACLSMMTYLQSTRSIAGLVSLSGWIPPLARNMTRNLLSFSELIPPYQISIPPPHVPILWTHGDADTEIPLSVGEDGMSYLKSVIPDPDLFETKIYPGLDHTTNEEEIIDVGVWIKEKLGL